MAEELRKITSQYIINPFRIDVDPMKRLLLVNFEKDPDTIYVGFEPQVFDDTVNGRGHLIIGWRRDGRVDVFHEASLRLAVDKYDIAGKGLAHMAERELPGAVYEINDFGVHAHYEFQDIHDRTVAIHITEKNPRKRKPFGLLAPMGSAAEAPSSMPLVLLHDFYFVRKQHTDIEISIDGKRHQPDQLPIPLDFAKMYFTRYSPEPLIATLNPAFDGQLRPLEVEAGEAEVRSGDELLTLDWSHDTPAIERITRNNETYPLELRFDKAFPDIRTLENGISLKGKFEIEGHPSTGRVAGDYTVGKGDDQIRITMIPAGGWQPRATKFSLRFLYTVAAVFKRWPSTYEWTALLRADRNGTYSMRSGWQRIK